MKKPYVSVTYCNELTGIEVGYDPRDGVFVLLKRLVGGELPEYPTHIDASTKIDMFYLDDLADLRGEKEVSSRFAGLPIEDAIANWAIVLRDCADDILRGDFQAFSELEKVVKAR